MQPLGPSQDCGSGPDQAVGEGGGQGGQGGGGVHVTGENLIVQMVRSQVSIKVKGVGGGERDCQTAWRFPFETGGYAVDIYLLILDDSLCLTYLLVVLFGG